MLQSTLAPMAALDQGTGTIRDLPSLLAGLDAVVGLVVRPPGRQTHALDRRSALVGQLILGLETDSLGHERPDIADLIRCDGERADIRSAMKRARRSGAKTCLCVNMGTPIPALLRQFHDGHDYALVRWDTAITDRFLTGLDALARDTHTRVMADNLCGADQVRRAVAAGIELGVVSSEPATHLGVSSLL